MSAFLLGLGLVVAACAGTTGPATPGDPAGPADAPAGPAGVPAVAPAVTPPPQPAAPASSRVSVQHPIRLAFIGDLRLGRGVADVIASDPASIFEQLGPTLAEADLAVANLEPPLSSRPGQAHVHGLGVDPSAAPLLAGAGIDVVSLASAQAGDAGSGAVLHALAATSAAGLRSVGAGADAAEAGSPLVLDVGGLRVGILAFDLTGAGLRATDSTPGVNAWRDGDARAAVTALRRQVDLLVVGLHRAAGDDTTADRHLRAAVDDVVAWGADIAWGHGTGLRRPVTVTDGPRPAVVAPGLGSAVTDPPPAGSPIAGTDEGTLLEVLADASGVLAMRTGTIAIEAGRAAFTGWQDPAGDAVALRGEWWAPVRAVAPVPAGGCDSFDLGRVVTGLQHDSRVLATSCGAVSGPNTVEMVVAYRHPLERKLLQRLYPGHRWADADGMSAHLAVMAPDARMVWAAGTLPEPVGAVAVCSGSVAVGHMTLDDPRLVAAGAWTWRDFGFTTAPLLPDPVSIGCADLDRDGATEPYVRRTGSPGGTAP